MIRKPKAVVEGFVVISFLLLSLSDVASSAEGSPKNAVKGGSCPHMEVASVPGSKILFEEDSIDFGQIPYNRKVTHVFRFQNVGAAPLSLASHVKSKVIEGC